MTRTVASLDGTEDEADWIFPGHVLARHEVDYIRSLSLPPGTGRRFVSFVGIDPDGPHTMLASSASGDVSDEALAWVRARGLSWIEQHPLGPWAKPRQRDGPAAGIDGPRRERHRALLLGRRRRVAPPAHRPVPAHLRGELMLREATAFEVVDTKPIRCDLGYEHKRAQVVRRYNLAIVEVRTVPNPWLAAYGKDDGGSRGYRAVDQFGDEWFSDWDAQRGDGPSNMWTTSDGRRAEQGRGAYPTYDQPRAYDGFVEIDALYRLAAPREETRASDPTDAGSAQHGE